MIFRLISNVHNNFFLGIRQLIRRNPALSYVMCRCSLDDEVFAYIATELNANLVSSYGWVA